MRRIDLQVGEIRGRIALGAAAALACAVLAGGASADDVAGQITASTGLVEASEDGAVGDGEHIRLGEDGGCSILVDQDAVVELCGDSSMVLRKDKRKRIVELAQGEIRVVVEPRDIEARVEIHTPAAIATLLGTIVHVSVDAETGATTISSAESDIAVRSADPNVRGTTVIETAEQLTVESGKAPPAKPKRMTREQIAALGGCLVDFHSTALGRDTNDHRDRVADRLAVFDSAGRDGISAPPPHRIPGAGNPLDAQEGVCVATDCRSDNMLDSEEPPEVPSETFPPPSFQQ